MSIKCHFYSMQFVSIFISITYICNTASNRIIIAYFFNRKSYNY